VRTAAGPTLRPKGQDHGRNRAGTHPGRDRAGTPNQHSEAAHQRACVPVPVQITPGAGPLVW